jgi:hypothetical protein
VGEPPNSLQTRGRVEVGGGAAIVAVPGGEQGGLTVGVVDEPSGGAGVRGQAVGVVDAYSRCRMRHSPPGSLDGADGFSRQGITRRSRARITRWARCERMGRSP